MLGHKNSGIENLMEQGLSYNEAFLHDLMLVINLDIEEYHGDIDFTAFPLTDTKGKSFILDTITTEGNRLDDTYQLELHFETDIETLEGFIDSGFKLDADFDIENFLKSTSSTNYIIEDCEHLNPSTINKITSAKLCHPESEFSTDVKITLES
jgi:hypothetical protein